jgi:hypothetical protein
MLFDHKKLHTATREALQFFPVEDVDFRHLQCPQLL